MKKVEKNIILSIVILFSIAINLSPLQGVETELNSIETRINIISNNTIFIWTSILFIFLIAPPILDNYFKKHYNHTKAFEKALKHAKTSKEKEEIYAHRGYYLMTEREWDDSIEVYKKVIEINPKNDEAHFNLAIIYEDKEEYDNAIEAYREVIEINPNDDEAYYNLARLYYRKKEYQNAIKGYEKVLKINPESELCYLDIGMSYYYLNELDKAIEFHKKSLQINPKQTIPYTNLFEFYLTQNQPFDQKLEALYLKEFNNDKETFLHYEIVKILQDISNSQKVDLEAWQNKYGDIDLTTWIFDGLDSWVDSKEEGEIKEKLIEALKTFKSNEKTI